MMSLRVVGRLLLITLAVAALAASSAQAFYFSQPQHGIDFSCGGRAALTHFGVQQTPYGQVFTLDCDAVGGVPTSSPASSGAFDRQRLRRAQAFDCPVNHYMDAIASVYDEFQADRLFRFGCHRVPNAVLRRCNIVDVMQQPNMQYQAQPPYVIASLYSQYTGYQRLPRTWRLRQCKVECDLNGDWVAHSNRRICSGLPAIDLVKFDPTPAALPFSGTCSGNGGVIFLGGGYSDEGSVPDRRWRFGCEQIGGKDEGEALPWSIVDMDAFFRPVAFACPEGSYLFGVKSAFVFDDNTHFGRVYSFRCRTITGASLSSCQQTTNVNALRGDMDFHAPRGHVITALHGEWVASTQDHRWSVTTCEVECASDQAPDGPLACVHGPCPTLTLENGAVTGDCYGRVGGVCTFASCDEGYELNPGSVSRECTESGTWTGTAPSCEPITCFPLLVANAQLSGSCSGNYGDVCRFVQCNAGFAATAGDDTYTCGANGWAGTRIYCQTTQCPPIALFPPRHTSGNCDGNIGDHCTLHCAVNEMLSSGETSLTRVCRQETPNAAAAWSGEDLACQPIICNELTLENGQLEGDCSGAIGSLCTYARCNANYRLSSSGSDTRVCQHDDGQAVWSGTPKTCERIRCPPIYDPHQRFYRGPLQGQCDGLTVGGQCTLSSCQSGYWFNDDARTVTCVDDGTQAQWSAPLAVCEAVSCPPLNFNHGALSPFCYNYVGASCSYVECDGGFRLSTDGDMQRTCVQDGETAYWSGTPKHCRAVTEVQPEETFNYRCPEGQGLIGVSTFAGTANDYTWGFVCADVGSDDENRVWKMHSDLNTIGSAIDFTCPYGTYYIGGVTSEFRSNDRIWSVECVLLHGARLKSCTTSTTVAGTFAFDAPAGHVITGLTSSSASGTLRTFTFRTCEVECDDDDMYFATGGTRCQRVGCGRLSLDNGQVSGECTGNIGDRCEYVSCNDNYQLSADGTTTRTCMLRSGNPVWSGRPKTCARFTTTTTAMPMDPEVLCSVYNTAPNPATCRSKCKHRSLGTGTFFKTLGQCSNVCTCGCERHFKSVRDQNQCNQHCSVTTGHLGVFREEHLGCRHVCLCVRVPLTSTAPPTSTTPLDSMTELRAYPFGDFGFEIAFLGVTSDGPSPRRFSTAFDVDAVISSSSQPSALACLRACLAVDECTGVYMRGDGDVDGSERGYETILCQVLRDTGTEAGVSTTARSISAKRKSFTTRMPTTSASGIRVIKDLVGNGTRFWAPDTALLETGLTGPDCVTFDGDRYLLVTLSWGHRVIRVDLYQRTTALVAGTGEAGSGGMGGPATSAELHRPQCAIADVHGNVFITERGNHRVSVVDLLSKSLLPAAGTGVAGHRGMGGSAALARVRTPQSLAWVDNQRLVFSDEGNHVVYDMDTSTSAGVIRVLAGMPEHKGSGGDGGLARAARLNSPTGLAVASGVLYIADSGNHRVRAVNLQTNVITTVAGTGRRGFSGDGGMPTSAQLFFPRGVTADGTGTIAIADSGNNRIRVFNGNVGAGSVIETVAGIGDDGYNGEDIRATDAKLNFPTGIVYPPTSKNIVFVDRRNRRVRQLFL